MDEVESVIELERKQAEIFRRIHMLAAKGYTIEWWPDPKDTIWFEHLGNGPDLILYAGGSLLSPSKVLKAEGTFVGETSGIGNENAEDCVIFERWLDTVVEPSWWQLGAPAREKYIVQPTLFLVIVLVGVAIAQVIETFWESAF